MECGDCFYVHKAKENYKMLRMCVRNFILGFYFFYRYYGFILTMPITGKKLKKKHYLLQKLYLRCFFMARALRGIHSAVFYNYISWHPCGERKL